MTYIFLTLKRRHNLMLNELKKFTSKLYIKILILVVIIVSIVVSVAPIKSFYAMKSGKTNSVEGKAAIPLLKERYEKDRKSTRLNSSHANISYAVFCLKK